MSNPFVASTAQDLRRIKTAPYIRNVRFAGAALVAYEQLSNDSLAELERSTEHSITGDTPVVHEIVSEMLDLMPHTVAPRIVESREVKGGRWLHSSEDD